jgi:SWI/SNF-related matrix-associated actin-dependent regulator of chromatin subfamily A member 5
LRQQAHLDGHATSKQLGRIVVPPQLFVSRHSVSSEPFSAAFDIGNNVVKKESLQSAQKLLSLFMLRRLKDQVEKLMPKKIETKVLCPLSSTQVLWYKALLMKDIGVLANTGDANTAGANKGTVLNNLIVQLRKYCLHPFLFPGAEANPDETSLEDFWLPPPTNLRY